MTPEERREGIKRWIAHQIKLQEAYEKSMHTNERDRAGEQHRRLYGKSDKVNSPHNNNPDFQDGYFVGMTTYGRTTSTTLLEVGQKQYPYSPENFSEWKRGMWAARTQMALAKMKSLPKLKI